MAKTSAQTLIADLAKRMDLDPNGSSERVDMLRQLNVSQQAIVQDVSLRFLLTDGTLSLSNNASSVAVPSTLDDGKAMALGKSSGIGDIEYVEPDAWYRTNVDGSPTSPIYYTISLLAGVLSFSFKPANTTGNTISIPYKAQLIPVAMTDSGASFSVLPEGWEDTLLLDHAELELRRYHNEAVPEYLATRAKDKQERLYASYRSTKEQTMTDREQQERKAVRELLSPQELQKAKRRGQDY